MVKKSTFCKLLYHRKCKRRGVGGQKKTILVNVVCEHPLTIVFNGYHMLQFLKGLVSSRLYYLGLKVSWG